MPNNIDVQLNVMELPHVTAPIKFKWSSGQLRYIFDILKKKLYYNRFTVHLWNPTVFLEYLFFDNNYLLWQNQIKTTVQDLSYSFKLFQWN